MAGLIGISRHRTGATWRLGALAHPHFEMLLILAGHHRTVTGGQALQSTAGDVVLHLPGRVHTEQTTGTATEWLCLGFAWPEAPARLRVQTRDDTGRLRVLAQWLLAERDSTSPGAATLRKRFLEALLSEFLESFREREHPLVHRIRTQVRERLAEPLTLADLAVHAGCSKYHFLRQYREHAGITPMADVRRLRLERARELVVGTELPLKAIAARTGLGDEHAFSRLFKRYTGMPPSHFRGAGEH